MPIKALFHCNLASYFASLSISSQSISSSASSYTEAKYTPRSSITTQQPARPPKTTQTAYTEAKYALQSSTATQQPPSLLKPPKLPIPAYAYLISYSKLLLCPSVCLSVGLSVFMNKGMLSYLKMTSLAYCCQIIHIISPCVFFHNSNTLFFSYKNIISQSEPPKEIDTATNKITTMFLNFGKSEPQHSYKHGSYKKKKV